MLDKRVADCVAALQGLEDGASVLVSGFGDAGVPFGLVAAILELEARDLTIASNNAGTGERGLAALLAAGRVRRVICSYPRSRGSHVFDGLYQAGRIELELVPQGTLCERMRCAGAGLGGFYSPVSVGTELANGKEVREIDGRSYVLETPLAGDFALIGARQADRWGNLTYGKSARNFGPVMATAARVVAVEVREFVELGTLDPECVVTPGAFVDRIVVAGAGS
jgi:3-oxoadipate CoA-transferase alpha subunit